MEQNQDTALEDLAYIKKIISDSKNVMIANGIGFIVWGIIIVLGLTSTYIRYKFNIPFETGLVWISLIAGGWVYTLIDIKLHHSKKAASTYAGKFMSALWISTGIALTIIGFVGTSANAYSGVYIAPLIANVLGISYFVTGTLQEYNWIKILAVCWWLGAILMFFISGLEVLIVMSVLMIALQIMPGIILYKKSRTQLKV